MTRSLFLIAAALLLMGASVSHEALDALLAQYVHAGRVNYMALRRERDALDTYVAQSASADATTVSGAGSPAAFWINVYNALVLRSVLDHAPAAVDALHRFNVRHDIAGFFDAQQFQVAGELLTLNAIERDKLRPLGDARIHFAIVCASTSCPDLQPEAYAPERLEEQLTRVTRQFLAQPKGLQLDERRRVLRLSMIFKWYRDDFGDLYAFLRRYAPPAVAQRPDLETFRVEYLPYDWTLNVR